MVAPELLSWLLACDEPWTRYRTRVDLLGQPEDHPDVVSERAALVAHPQVQGLVAIANSWPGSPLKPHNDAAHPIYALSTLADFGLRAEDPGLAPALEAVLAHQSAEGALQTQVQVAEAFGGSGAVEWSWMACDAPTLLYALLAMGLGADPRVARASAHVASLAGENGWGCRVAAELGRFRGPGRKDDPCPIACVYALKALALVPELADGPAARAGVATLLELWEHQRERRPYLFGIGSTFRKPKYPYVWYDLLHVTEVLTRFPWARADGRLQVMLATLAAQADALGRYTPGSVYLAWKGWSFGQKRAPSPWLTLLACRILARATPPATT
ncbi:MAG: hypothetical protein V1772_04905 [Chloroflexota bacterium]